VSDTIKVTDNFDQGAALFDKIARRAGNTVGLMGQCAGIMHDEVEENFEKEGRPDKWRPLAQSTIRARRRKGNWPGKILQVRGRLAASFQEKHDNNTAIVGTNVKYAAIQHFGGESKHAARMRITHHAAGGRFAKPNGKATKGQYGMKSQGKAYSVKLPARPILYIGQGGIQRMLDAGKAWLTGNRW
jgi:phage virion morphogenesis protein